VADLVIAVGGRRARHITDRGRLWPKAQVLQIGAAPRATSQGAIVARRHRRADARLGVEALTAAVAPETGWRTPALARFPAETPADPAEFPATPGLHDPRDVAAALDRALPGAWEMVSSSGHCSDHFAQPPGRAQARFLTIREFGAIGVAVARPERPMALFDGDGGLMMHAQELETIRRLGLRILVCVLNDGAYGSEIRKLRDDGLPDDGAVFGHTDLAAMARGFGLGCERVTDLAAVPGLTRAFSAGSGAALRDFPASDRVASPVVRRAHPGGHCGTERPIAFPAEI
jgi:thiamine pyrophosphate-dependent acetolactate synthase large subunit-like protein